MAMLVLVFLTALATQPTNQNTTLKGRVVDAEKQPIANALVVISNVQPASGKNTRCTATFDDYTRLTTTDANGNFRFEGLNPNFEYRCSAGASGFTGVFGSDFFQTGADDIELQMEKFVRDNPRVLRGRIFASDGTPAAGAMLQPRTVSQAITRLATRAIIADQQGEFEIQVDRSVANFSLRAFARGAAIQDVNIRPSDNKPIEIRMTRGASIRGQLVHDRRPQVGVALSLIQEDRSMGNLTTPVTVYTDGEGVFQFDHLPPSRDYALHTQLNSNVAFPLPVHLITAPADGKRAELGNVDTVEPRTISIKVINQADDPLPEASYVFLARDEAWDTARFDLEPRAEQVVKLTDAGPESFTIGIRAMGFKVLKTNPITSPDMNRRYRINVQDDTSFTIFLTRE